MKRKASFPAPAERNKKRSAGIFILYKKRAARRQPKGNKEKNFKRECRAKRPDHLHWQQRTVSLL